MDGLHKALTPNFYVLAIEKCRTKHVLNCVYFDVLNIYYNKIDSTRSIIYFVHFSPISFDRGHPRPASRRDCQESMRIVYSVPTIVT